MNLSGRVSTRLYPASGNVTDMQVGIVARKGSADAVSVATRVRDAVRDRGETVWLDEETAGALGADGRSVAALADCDLAVAIGGDGTFLFAARNAGGTPVLGVNLGEVGFLTTASPDDAERAVVAAVEALRAGDLHVRSVPRLAARANDWESVPAANEVLVQGERRGPGGGIDYELRIDGSRYSGGHADGVIVATPAGSTAYNLSERGPLIHPDVDALAVTEAASENGMPPLAADVDATVTVSVTDSGGAVVVADGRTVRELSGPVEVSVERTAPPMRIAGPESDFFEALEKLS